MVAGVAQAINMLQRAIDDEGVYVAQAWAIIIFTRLAPYTYWYDHPPLGWIQLSLFDSSSSRSGPLIRRGRRPRGDGRCPTRCNVVLLWMLGPEAPRSPVGPQQWESPSFSFSPLAIQYHRSVYLDNIAVVWALLAFMLALSPRRRLVHSPEQDLLRDLKSSPRRRFCCWPRPSGWQIWRTAGPIHRPMPSPRRRALRCDALALRPLCGAKG